MVNGEEENGQGKSGNNSGGEAACDCLLQPRNQLNRKREAVLHGIG